MSTEAKIFYRTATGSKPCAVTSQKLEEVFISGGAPNESVVSGDKFIGGAGMFETKPYKLAALREWNIRMSREETPEIFDPVVAHILRSQGFQAHSEDYYEPRSVYSVHKLYEQLESFDPSRSIFVNLKDTNVQRGIAFAYKVFGKGKDIAELQPLKLWDETIISNWKGSAGITAYGQTKREAFSRGLLSANRILGNVNAERRKPEPCLALTRPGKNGKSRLIWGYPMSMTLIEGTVAKPLLKQLKGGTTPMAFAMTNKTLGMKILSASQSKKYYYSLDASQFDSSIQAAMIRVAFSIIRTWYDCKSQFDENNTIGEVFDIIEDYFIYTPIVMPTGDKDVKGEGILHFGKKHGVPSGSYFTQLVDSIVNVIVLGALASKFGFFVNREEVFVLGDDLLFFTNTHLDMGKLASYAKSTFGMNFNKDKSEHGRTGEKIPFLGRDWVKGMPTRGTIKAIKKMLYPESFRRYNDPRQEGRLVVLSYNLSAVQETRLIPDLRGWHSKLRPELIAEQAGKLSGFMRYRLSRTDLRLKPKGATNLLEILNM
jgi:hypothetical protein